MLIREMSLHSPGSYRVSARGVTSDVAADGVTSEYCNVLGMRMVAGRFVSGGERPVRPGDQPHEAVISERLVGAGVRQRSTGRW